jgi:kumamolisin
VTDNPDSNAETTLDVETAGALAPDAQIDVYEGQSLLDIYTQIAFDDTDQVVSTSDFSGCESDEPTWYLDAVAAQLSKMATQGQEMVSASGDHGSEACSADQASDTSLSVQDPGSQPYVTSVGGTSLSISASGEWEGETVWNDCVFDSWSSPGNCASGGGYLKCVGNAILAAGVRCHQCLEQ